MAHSSHIKDKLSIYPEPEPELILVEEPNVLEKHIGTVRETVTKSYGEGYGFVHGCVNKWIGIEHAVEKRIKSLKPADESLTPGILYVGVATLSGSILARSRSRPLRFILPPALFLLSFNYFLPKTAINVSEYLSSLEHQHLPRLGEIHDSARAHTASSVEMARDAYVRNKEALGRGVDRGFGWVQESTGLKLREALGWGRSAEERVVEAVSHGVQDVKALIEKKDK